MCSPAYFGAHPTIFEVSVQHVMFRSADMILRRSFRQRSVSLHSMQNRAPNNRFDASAQLLDPR